MSEQKPKTFKLQKIGNSIIVSKLREHVVDGIVSGIVLNIVILPLLVIAFFLGLWMLVVSIVHEHSLLLFGMGIMFVTLSLIVFSVFVKSQTSLFPYECRFTKNANGSWMVKRKLWFLPFSERQLQNWIIVCQPSYMRGDWGCSFWIKQHQKQIRLTAGGVFTDSKERAKTIATEDLAILKDCFSVQGEFQRWD